MTDSEARTGKAVILVVDDTPENLTIMRDILKDQYKVMVANGGERGIEIALSNPQPDLILLDVMMPGVNGYEVCKRLKAEAKTHDIPVIFLTAKNETEDEHRGFEVGAVDYITKPISPPIALARIKTQLQLAESESRFRKLSDSSFEGIIIHDNGMIIDANERCSSITGYKREELIGKNMMDLLVHPESKQLVMENIRNGYEEPYEIFGWSKGGVPINAEVRGRKMDYKGKQVRVAVFRDISAQKAAEKELKEAEERWKFALEGAGDAAWDWNLETGTAFFSRRYKEMLGYDGDESWISGEEWSKRVHPDDMASITAAMQAHFEGKIPNAGGEFRMLCKDGGWKWVLGRGMVVRRAENGKPLRLVGTNSDISERKNAEKYLREAKDIAENATKLKDQFVSLVAHDLRSPFNSLLGFLRIMEKDAAPPLHEKHKAMTKRLIDTSSGMINMIDEILNISRLQTGSMTPKSAFFDARPLAARMINNIEHLANAKHIKIVNFLPSGMRLFADQQLFGEVVSNLLSNAIKFSHDGGKVTVFSPEGKNNVVGIKDTGLGVAADILPDLFKSEVKTTSLGTMGEKGTGLGLPFCHEIMKIHGGSLSVSSTLGEGTVFYAELPPKTPVVLVVEDSDMSREMMKDMLELLQVNIIEATTGEEAIEMMASAKPDLVLLDIILPGIDGFCVLEKIRKMDGMSKVPVLIITSDNNEETRIKGFELGAQDFIPKPFERENLFPRIMRFIG